MTASRTGLIVLTVIAAVLGVAVAVDTPRRAVVVSRRLIDGFDPAAVTAIAIARPGAPAVELVRDPDGRWRVAAPAPGPADPAAVADLLGAVETAVVQRRVAVADAEAAGAALATPVATVTVRRGAGAVALVLGAAIPATEQRWLRVDGDRDAVVVDAWVARALDRDLATLRDPRAVRAASVEVTGLEIHAGAAALVAAGRPLMLLPDGGGRVRLDPAIADALLTAITGLRVEAFPAGAAGADADAGPGGAGEGVAIRVLGATEPRELIEVGPCPGAPGRRLIEGSAGRGCVDAAALAAIAAFARRPIEELIDPRPVDVGHVVRLESRGQLTLTRRGAGWTVTPAAKPAAAATTAEPMAADDDAVGALVAALGRRWTVEGSPDHTRQRAVWIATYDDGGTVELMLADHGDTAMFHLPGTSLSLVATAADAALLAATTFLSLRDRAMISEEPAAVAAVVAGPVRVQRGAAVGDWVVVAPAGATIRAAAVDAIRDAASSLRAQRWLAGPSASLGAVRRELTIGWDAPPVAGGTPVQHRVVVGAALPDGGCRVAVDDLPIAEVAAPTCAVLLAPLLD